jgi:hypothetical protein
MSETEELQKDTQGNLINPYFNNPDYIKSDTEESFISHGERVMNFIYKQNLFVYGIDKACAGMTSIIIVLSQCEGGTMKDAVDLCIGLTGLTRRTISDRIQGFRAIKVISRGQTVEFLHPFERKRLT